MMNKQVKKHYEQIAAQTGLTLDPAVGMIHGKRDGFDVTVFAPNASYPYILQIQVSALRAAGVLTNDEVRELRRAHKAIHTVTQKGSVLALSLKNPMWPKKAVENAAAAVEILLGFLRAHGFYNACQTCGRPGQADSCLVGGQVANLCPACYALAQQGKQIERAHEENIRENAAAGAVGALLGSLAGVVCIVILSRLGYVAALSGLIMAVCALKGYELLGGKLTKKGVVISGILMLVMTYVGDQIDWAIVVASELGWDFFTSFRSVPELVSEGAIDGGAYWGNLVMLYLFVLLGAVPTIYGALKKRQAAKLVYHMGDSAASVQM